MMSSKLTNRALKGLVSNSSAVLPSRAFSSKNLQMERQQHQHDKGLQAQKASMAYNDVRLLYQIPQEYYDEKRRGKDSHRAKSSSWYKKGIASLLVIPFAFSMQTAFALTNNTSDEKSVVMMTSSLQLPSPSISQVYSKDFLPTQNSSMMLKKNDEIILKKESFSLSLPQSVNQNMCPEGLLDANVSKLGSSCLLQNSSLQFPANSPIEDSFAIKQFKNRPDLLYAAVFDGHSGFQLAHFAMNNLHEQIDKNFLKYGKNMNDVIYHSFDQIDQSFKKVAKELFFNGWHGAGEIGSCALVTIIDKANQKLICANSGDCMAVKLSTKSGSKDYNPTLLSYAYSANNLEEQKKYRQMYPNEPDIIYCRSEGDCYIKNRRQPTKAFGNYQIRDKEFNFHSFSKNFGYKSPIVEMKQQYVDHVPQIRQFDLAPQDEFVVLATDGLWDEMDEVQVAQIVSKVVEEKRVQKNQNNVKDLIMRKLLVRSLEKAAARNKMTLDELMKIKTPARRNLHDDVTIVVVDLKNDLK